MEHILYWLWLTTKYGVTPSKIKVLLEYFKTVEEIYFSKNFNNIYGLSDKIKSSLADKDLSKADIFTCFIYCTPLKQPPKIPILFPTVSVSAKYRTELCNPNQSVLVLKADEPFLRFRNLSIYYFHFHIY